jgi:hypothetical protein
VLGRRRVDQLRRDPNAVSGASYTAFDQVARAQLGAHALQVEVASPILEARVARDHRERSPARKPRDQVLGQSVCEERLVRIRGQIVEGQDRDGGSAVEGGNVWCAAAQLGIERPDEVHEQSEEEDRAGRQGRCPVRQARR